MMTIKGMKSWLKAEGANIRKTRNEMKNEMRDNIAGAWIFQNKLDSEKMYYRCNHIAYGLARGKEYENIEKKTRKGNEPNWNLINSILSEITIPETTLPEKEA